MKEKKDKTKKYIPLYFDALFFKVFGEEDKLESLTYLVEETLNIKVKNIEIKNSKLLGQKFKTKRSYLDLLVSLNDDTKLSIEVNTNTSKTTMERNLLFIFKVMVNDIKIDKNYNDLLNYIQINLNHEESKDDYNIEKYVLMEENSYKKLTEKLQIYKINLSFYANKCYTNSEINKLSEFEKLMGLIGTETQEQYDLFSKEEGMLKEIMRNSDKFRDDSDVVEMYDYETEMKRIYEIEKQNAVKEEVKKAIDEEAQKYEQVMQDHETEMKRIYEIEKQNAVKEEVKKAIDEEAQKYEKKQKEIAINMLNMNMQVKEISKITGLSIKEVNKLKK